MKTPTSQQVLGRNRNFLNKEYKDQNDRNGKIYRFEKSLAKPHLWGTSIIGFGEYHYTYASGREGDWFLTGFSPRKQALYLYLMCDLANDGLTFDGLGKYKIGKGCLYIKRLSDIDLKVLEQLIKDSIEIIKKKYS